MARFVFSMESILQIKLKLEDQAKAEYAVQMAELQREQGKLELLQKHKDEVQEQLRQQISAVLDLFRIRQLENGVENIKYNILCLLNNNCSEGYGNENYQKKRTGNDV